MARARNNIVKLSWDSRSVICEMLFAGEEYDAIRTDAAVSAECTDKGLTLHGTTFLAYSKGTEYVEYCTRRYAWDDKFVRRQVAARMIGSSDASGNIAKAAEYELMRICIEKLEKGDDLEPKELSSISNAVASYNRNRIAAEKEDGKREFSDRKAVYQSKIAELAAIVAAQAERLRNLAGDIDGAAVADEMNKNLGLGT